MVNKVDVNKSHRDFTHSCSPTYSEIETVLQRKHSFPRSPIQSVIACIKQASLRTKATAFAIAISTLPIFGIGGVTYYLVSQSLTKEVIKIKQGTARELADNIQKFIEARTQEIELFAKQSFLVNSKQKSNVNFLELQAQFKNWKEIYHTYESLAVLQLNGQVFLQTQEELTSNQKNQEYFQEVLKSNQPYITQIYTNTNTQLPRILLAVPVKDSVTNKPIYILRAIISVESLARSIQKLSGSKDKYHLVDASGKIFLARDNIDVGKDAEKVIANWEQLRVNHQIVTRVFPDRKGGAEDLITYIPWQIIKAESLPALNWKLVVSTDKGVALATQKQLLLTLAIGIIVTALLVGAIAAILANRLTLPIQTATVVVKKLAQGSLDTRIHVRGEDEFATLGASINRMADRLQDLLHKQKVEAERLKIFTNILTAIRQSLSCEDLFNITVTEARQALGAHRVVIYHFNAHGSGQIIAESVAPGLPATLGETIEDNSIAKQLMEAYSISGLLIANNIFEMDFACEYLKLMERLQVKAILATPILKDNQIFGFLMAHYCWAPHLWQPFEINFLKQLAVQVGLSLERVSLLQVTQALKDFAIHLSGNLNSQEIYNLAVQNIRKVLKVDRVVFCKLDEKWQADIVAESAVDDIPRALEMKLSALQDNADKYCQKEVLVINNISQAGFSESWVKQLESSLAVKASLEAPILLAGNVVGLLIAHQCTRTRVWQQTEIDLFEQFARLVTLALEGANLLEQSEKASQLQREQTEQLQQQLLKLLDRLGKVKKGDLTVRVEVPQTEVGAIAEFCNSMVENFQDVVIQVKAAANQLNGTVVENSGAIAQLAIDAFKKQQEISRTLDAVDRIRLSIKGVAKNAKLATAAARTACPTAEIGDTVMELTVENILSLREAMGETARKLKRLSEYSQNISRLTSSLNQIALQTNLLAINAGVEASGTAENLQSFFSSFCQQVATLAVETAGVTGEIEGIATNIQQELSEVLRAMEIGSARVVEVTRLVDDSKHSFSQMLDVCRQIDELVQSISTATASQIHTSKEVIDFMQEIAKVSEITSRSSRKIFATLQKTAEIYQQLQAIVKNFQVS